MHELVPKPTATISYTYARVFRAPRNLDDRTKTPHDCPLDIVRCLSPAMPMSKPIHEPTPDTADDCPLHGQRSSTGRNGQKMRCHQHT